jgi:mono/diheme cytochrome c family protein
MTELARKGATLSFLLLFFAAAATAPAWAQNGIQQVFEKNCASCHGKDGSGKTPAAAHMKIPDLRSQEVQQLSDKQIFDTIAYGTGHKQYPHAWADKGMTGVLIRDLVEYLRELVKPPKKPAKATN